MVLSTSVTFLSLPGLDSFARVAGLVAVLLSAASMTSSVIALFRFKADMHRADAYGGGESFIIQPVRTRSFLGEVYLLNKISSQRRNIVLSLPLIFLAYSLLAVIVGISLYSFRGTTVNPITHPFDDYTKWTVVGAIGGLVCMLLVSAVLSRR
jgi:hypothetical protein